MIVGFLEEFLVIGRRARPDRSVIGQAGAILIVQALQRRPGTGLDGQDPLQGVARERVITHRALDSRQHVIAAVQAEKTQHLAGLALAVAMSAEQAFQEAQRRFTQLTKSLAEHLFLLFRVARRAMCGVDPPLTLWTAEAPER